MSRQTILLGGVLVLATAVTVVVGVAWDNGRVADVAAEPYAATDLYGEGSRPLSVVRGAATGDSRLSVVFVRDAEVAGWDSLTTFDDVAVRDWEQGGPVSVLERSDPAPADAGGAPTADVVVVAVGSVDAASGTAIQPFSERYGDLLDSVTSASPGAALVCLGTWLPDAAGHPYDYAIQTQCEARGARFRTLTDVFDTPVDRDDTAEGHPTEAGHRAIAATILGSVTVVPG